MTAIVGSALFVAALVLGWPAAPAVGAAALFWMALSGRVAVAPLILVACALAGAARGSQVISGSQDVGDPTGPHRATLVGYARRTEVGQRFVVERDDGVTLCASADTALALGRGDVIRFDGNVSARRSQSPSRAAALRQLGCDGTVEAVDIRVLRQGSGLRRWLDGERRDIAGWFAATVPGDAGALLSGLVIGEDDGLSFDTREGFYTLGMSHITAVSGSNLALLTWILLGGAGRRRVALDLVGLTMLWLYVLLAGAGPSTVRAGLTATLCVLVVRTGRRPELLATACLVAAAQVAVDPSLIGSLAYRLSTIAMLVMISTLTGRAAEGWAGKLRSLVACTVAIQLAVLPFTPNADQAIVAGVVANVAAAPLVGLAFAVGMAAAVVRPVSETAATALATVAELPARMVLDIVGGLSGSWLADVRPSALAWLPQQALRALLVMGVVVGFGHHARRGVADARTRLETTTREERLVWASAAGGVAFAVAVVSLAR